MQKLLTLFVTAAILYMLYQQSISKMTLPDNVQQGTGSTSQKQNDTPKEPLQGTFFEKTLSSMLINVLKSEEGRSFLESMIKPMNQSVAGSSSGFKVNNDDFIKSLFKIHSFDEGHEGPVSCGHIVKVHYKILDNHNYVVDDKVITFPLGSEKIAPGVDAVIVGMKVGETRNATIDSKYLQNQQNSQINIFKINILLQEIIPKNFIDSSVKIFDDQIVYQLPLMCGNRAVYDARVTRLSDSKTIFNSEATGKQIDMNIGHLNYPVIFSHALHNKIPVGTRTIITKGKFLKSYLSDYSIIFPTQKMPENEYFMVELYNFNNTNTQTINFPYQDKNLTNKVTNVDNIVTPTSP